MNKMLTGLGIFLSAILKYFFLSTRLVIEITCLDEQKIIFIPFHTVGPTLPFGYLYDSVMNESPDGDGVLIFGGQMGGIPDKIMELQVGANSWEILTKTLKNPKYQHTVIPIP